MYWVSSKPIQPAKMYSCVFIITMYIFACIECDLIIRIVYAAKKNVEPPSGQLPLGGNSDGVYKHSAGENWAGEVKRL
jgi:hypothetical protein